MTTILLAGDDAGLILSLRKSLTEDAKFNVVTARKELSILLAATEDHPDLIVLDVAQIDASSMNTIARIRQTPGLMGTAIMVLSKRHAAEDVAKVLDIGADLFLAKPVVNQELVARIKALLRRTISQNMWETQALIEIDVQQRNIHVNKRVVNLTPVEFQLIHYLCESDQEYHSAHDLLRNVWGYPEGTGDTALVRNHIRNLRSKIEDDAERPRIVESMPKRGYRINANIKWATAPAKYTGV